LLSAGVIVGCSGASPVGASGAGEAASARRSEESALVFAAAEAPVAAQTVSLPVQVTVLEPEREIETGEWLWNADGAPDAATQIVVDLAAQKIYVYRGTVQVGRSTINYGADNKPTPTGTFRILQKKRHHISNLYGAPMPYMLRLTMDGIAIHASPVEDGAATHGCIGLPDGFAALLFAEAGVGTRVTITNGGDVSLGDVA